MRTFITFLIITLTLFAQIRIGKTKSEIQNEFYYAGISEFYSDFFDSHMLVLTLNDVYIYYQFKTDDVCKRMDIVPLTKKAYNKYIDKFNANYGKPEKGKNWIFDMNGYLCVIEKRNDYFLGNKKNIKGFSVYGFKIVKSEEE